MLNPHPSLSARLRVFEPLQGDANEGNFLRAELHSYSYAVTPLFPASSSQGRKGLVMDLPGAQLISALPRTDPSNSTEAAVLAPVAALYNLTLPPGSSLVVSLRLQKRFLKREYIPADASKGMHLASGAVHWQWLRETEGEEGLWHSFIPPAALVTVPFPDASMPFNVITMVSTVMALLLGSMINVLVRKSSLKQQVDDASVDLSVHKQSDQLS